MEVIVFLIIVFLLLMGLVKDTDSKWGFSSLIITSIYITFYIAPAFQESDVLGWWAVILAIVYLILSILFFKKYKHKN